jgi:glutathione S-transferase
MSHYCEKARWALERQGIPYYEERHLQGFHYLRTYWVSGGPNVPVLIDGKKTISDSTAILHHLDRYASPENCLYPSDSAQRQEVETMEELFDEQLGVESRRWLYYHCLKTPAKSLGVASQGVPAFERMLGPACFSLLKFHIDRMLQISENTVQEGLKRCQEIISYTDSLLADDRKYLVGESFSAADLTLACMMAPFILPRQYGIELPFIAEMPYLTQSTIRSFRETRTGQFALHLFATER